ncbi:MAG: hydrogenase nickel incorporation protein HypB [Trueperaceae bacterium]|nr:MAG: hydrogenase nickel incorporation protein HypB [Trueperaceae bacterium]
MAEVRTIGLSVLTDKNESRGRTIEVEKGVLSRNQELADELRKRFGVHGILALNFVSSPGSGKTTLLARTFTDMPDVRAGVIVGDLATDNDATTLRASGAETVQIMTGGVCHLEASMVSKAVAPLPLEELDLVAIENVGNLVCPAAFDLGEDLRIVMLSVTEGEDKPLKYPTIFKSADVVILTKTDLAEAVGFDRSAALENLRLTAPGATVFEVSARSGEGLSDWYDYLANRLGRAQ